MRFFSEYFRLMIFGAAMLMGIQLPSIVEQYGKALQAHQLEAQLSMKQFSQDAKMFFGGDMDELIKHYKNSNDKVFKHGGDSLKAMQTRLEVLNQAINAFNQTAYSPYIETLLHPIKDIRDQVIKNYTYTIVLNPTAIAIGAGLGLCLTILLQCVFGVVGFIFGFKRKQATS